MSVYLIHFERPYRHAQHYLGYADDVDSRMTQHRNGYGARLIQVINDAGIDWQLVRTWEGDRKLERRLKNQKNARRFCPICHKGGNSDD